MSAGSVSLIAATSGREASAARPAQSPGAHGTGLRRAHVGPGIGHASPAARASDEPHAPGPDGATHTPQPQFPSGQCPETQRAKRQRLQQAVRRCRAHSVHRPSGAAVAADRPIARLATMALEACPQRCAQRGRSRERWRGARAVPGRPHARHATCQPSRILVLVTIRGVGT